MEGYNAFKKHPQLNEDDMLGIFLDLETNGLNPFKQRIIEIAFKIVDVYTSEVKASFDTIVYQPYEVWENSNPHSLQVNGFSWELVASGQSEIDVAREILRLFELHEIKKNEAVFICQNPSFDRMFFSQLIDADTQAKLQWPYHWLDLGSMYWAFRIHSQQYTAHHLQMPILLSKDHIAQQYKLPQEPSPHRAMNGVDHLIQCYDAVVGFPHKDACSNPLESQHKRLNFD